MAESQQDFRVIREHVGDRPYAEGEIRTADPRVVEHLIGKVLEPIEDKPAPAGKARKAPSKSASSRKRKG